VYTIELTFHESFTGLTHVTSFELIVSCVTKITWDSSVSDQIQYIYDDAIDVSLPKHKIEPSECPYELEYSA